MAAILPVATVAVKTLLTTNLLQLKNVFTCQARLAHNRRHITHWERKQYLQDRNPQRVPPAPPRTTKGVARRRATTPTNYMNACGPAAPSSRNGRRDHDGALSGICLHPLKPGVYQIINRERSGGSARGVQRRRKRLADSASHRRHHVHPGPCRCAVDHRWIMRGAPQHGRSRIFRGVVDEPVANSEV